MSYRIEGKDIVISGFEKGIADSPYLGISDMRNIDNITVPGEASAGFSVTNTVTQVAVSAAAVTVDDPTDTFTWAGTTPLLANTAITTTAGGVNVNNAYYIVNPTGTTFQISLTAGGSPAAVSGASGVFSTINMGKPKFFAPLSLASSSGFTYSYFMADDNGRVWYYYQGSQWIYMKSLGANNENTGGGSSGNNGNGLVIYKNYLFLFRQQQLEYIQVAAANVVSTLTNLTTAGNWNLTWQSLTAGWITTNQPADVSHYAIVGQDDVIYFCNTAFVGSLFQVDGQTFDPTNAATYTYNRIALALPTSDNAQCLAELGTKLLVGGTKNQIYPWDRISNSYTYPILLSENGIARMVTVNTNTYIFCGQRGRIFVTNGSQAELFAKIPDHLSGTISPYFTWGDAAFSRNKLLFGVQATDNAGTAINTYGGTWAIDLNTNGTFYTPGGVGLRVLNQQSYGTYAGITSALFGLLGSLTSDGSGLLMGWYTSSNTTGSVDKGSATPYTGGQSYVDSDLIPVGTFLKPFNPSQIEWKTSVPIGANGTTETVALYYRPTFFDSYTLIGTTSSATGLLVGGASAISDKYTASFEGLQWAQFRVVLTPNATTPTYCRLTEMRIRDYPSEPK